MTNIVNVRTVASISEQLIEMERQIKARAYEHFQLRNSEENSQLDDWLTAQRELTGSVAATVNEEDNRFVAYIDTSDASFEDLEVLITDEDILVSASKPFRLFKAIHLPRAIDPTGAQAEFAQDVLRVTIPFSRGASFKKSA